MTKGRVYFRTCSECGADLSGAHHRQLTCSGECRTLRRNAKIAEWKTANPDRIRQRAAEYYAEDPARQKAATAAWRAANPEKSKALNKIWHRVTYYKKREHYLAYSHEYLAAHPGLVEFHRGRLRIRLRKAKEIFRQFAEINPKVYEVIAGVKDKDRAMLRALKTMGIEVTA